MSLSGKKDSSSGSRGNPPNGRKRRLSSRNSNSLYNSSTNNTRTVSSHSRKDRDKVRGTKRGRYSTSPLQHCEQPSTSASLSPSATDECLSTSSQSPSSLELESDMAHISVPSASGQSPLSNNFKGAGINNHKRPGQGKKIIIKNRKGKES